MGEQKQSVAKKGVITKDMTIGDVVGKWPETARIMGEYGLHCIGCHVSLYETIEQGCLAHGMPEEAIDNMISDMNKLVSSLKKEGE